LRHTLLIFVGLVALQVAGQNHEPCGHVDYMNYLEELQPGFKAHTDEVFSQALAHSKVKSKFQVQDTVHTIKVVFHIVYNNGNENIHDSLIHSQMKVLNECYRRNNPDTINTRDIFKDVAGDVGIEFVLADEDPNGNPTTGIVRQSTPITNFVVGPGNYLSNADRVKFASYGSPAWNTSEYLNIWVCDLGGSLYGFAFPPTGAANWNSGSFVGASRQGVVLHYNIVGEGNPGSNFTGAKTAVHEVGHYLGLRHVWGDAPTWDRCNAVYDDGIDDTPLAGTPSSLSYCAFQKNSCYTGANDLPDMLENYMDYSQGFCQNMFTNGQIKLMRANLTFFRPGIFETRIPPVIWPVPVESESSIYPNPAQNELFIIIKDHNEESSYRLELVNLLGQVVHSKEVDAIFWQKVNWQYALTGMHYYRLIENDDNTVIEGKILFEY
jgi:hypothetical protein